MSDLRDALEVWAEFARVNKGVTLDFVTLCGLAANAERQEAELEQAQADLAHHKRALEHLRTHAEVPEVVDAARAATEEAP